MGGDIIAELNFFSHTIDGSPPWTDVSHTLAVPTSNYAKTPARIIIHDLRGKENSFNLDTHAFEVHKYDGHIHDEFDNDSEAQRSYYEELAAFLKKRLGASRVVIFNHIFRYRGPTRPIDKCDSNHKHPAIYPHVDFDEAGVRLKMKEVLGEEEAEKLMQNRFQLINIWKPIGPNPITKNTLTICDYRSLDLEKDIHLSELRGSAVAPLNCAISHNAQGAQKWYYMSEMRSDEMLVFKIFDSYPNVAQLCAHSGFTNEHVPETDAQQISIEARCFVFYD
ncbi:unnamed protein product [Rotaria sp. Silwood1]|nr:unnamed protein product [Rotaria sp. Silwood1]